MSDVVGQRAGARAHGRLYANTGDWVESLTALRETQCGALQLVNHHGEVLAELATQSHPAQQRAA
ncbi:hypothetical protein XaplCFBP3122_13160 [Xanthomonas arboricola pv. populi]|uniref:Uncharacterized protein n=1 Tax=Xanthomonas arboricola pv. populi TaxID=487823 RepID=A0A2S6Z3B6_9XANT|nr:hypothetical protein XaplCFBP3122_13160 [Xanthomonas arboricola pv. populi]